MLYVVLDGLYVRGLSTRQMRTTCSVSESTLHRYRREGIRVLARELSEQEELFRRDRPDVASG
jgi:DNA-directed RNA polymerase specialized sigma24 family protein